MRKNRETKDSGSLAATQSLDSALPLENRVPLTWGQYPRLIPTPLPSPAFLLLISSPDGVVRLTAGAPMADKAVPGYTGCSRTQCGLGRRAADTCAHSAPQGPGEGTITG